MVVWRFTWSDPHCTRQDVVAGPPGAFKKADQQLGSPEDLVMPCFLMFWGRTVFGMLSLPGPALTMEIERA